MHFHFIDKESEDQRKGLGGRWSANPPARTPHSHFDGTQGKSVQSEN